MIFQQLLGPFPEICLDFIYIPSTERFECSDHGIFDLNMSHLILCLVRWTAYCIVSKFAWQLVGMYYFAIDRLQIWGRKSCQFTIEKFLSSDFKTSSDHQMMALCTIFTILLTFLVKSCILLHLHKSYMLMDEFYEFKAPRKPVFRVNSACSLSTKWCKWFSFFKNVTRIVKIVHSALAKRRENFWSSNLLFLHSPWMKMMIINWMKHSQGRKRSPTAIFNPKYGKATHT